MPLPSTPPDRPRASPLEAVRRLDAAFMRLLARAASSAQGVRIFMGLLFVLVAFTSPPDFTYFLRRSPVRILTHAALQKQADHPLTPAHYDPTEHISQLAFRLTLPVISHVTGMPVAGWHYIAIATVLLFWWMFYRTVRRRSGDGVAALLAVLALADVYASRSFISDTVGWFDCYAYLGMAATLCVRRPGSLFLVQFAACFLDERVYLMAPFAVLYWQWQQAHDRGLRPGVQAVFTPSPQALAVAGAVLAALALRLYLGQAYGLSLTVENQRGLSLKTWEENLALAGTAIFSGLEMLSFAILLFCWYAGQRLGRWMGGLALAYYIFCLGAMLIVIDHTRTQTYLVLPALAGLLCVAQAEGERLRRLALRLMAYGCWVVPPVMLVTFIYSWLGWPVLIVLLSLAKRAAHLFI